MTKHPLKSWRERHSITQAELALRVGVTRWTIVSIENRNRNASRDLIASLLSIAPDLRFEDFTVPASEPERATA